MKNIIQIDQSDWLRVCSELNETLADSRRLDFLLMTRKTEFKNRKEIDAAIKRETENNPVFLD